MVGCCVRRAVCSLVKVELFFNCMSTCLCTTIHESEVVVFGCMSSCTEVESRCLGACLYCFAVEWLCCPLVRWRSGRD